MAALESAPDGMVLACLTKLDSLMLGDSGGTAPQPPKRHGTALECTAGTYQPWYNAKIVLDNTFGTPDVLGNCLVRIWYRGPVWPLKRCCTIAGRWFFCCSDVEDVMRILCEYF